MAEVYQIFISILLENQTTSLLLEVGQETPIGHVGHYNVWGGACIQTHSNQTHHMRMFEFPHLQTLFHNLINLSLVKVACKL